MQTGMKMVWKYVRKSLQIADASDKIIKLQWQLNTDNRHKNKDGTLWLLQEIRNNFCFHFRALENILKYFGMKSCYFLEGDIFSLF